MVLFGIVFCYVGTMLIKQMQIIGFMQQPPLTDCQTMRQSYDRDMLKDLAFQEFLGLKEARQNKELDLNNGISRSGALFCFC